MAASKKKAKPTKPPATETMVARVQKLLALAGDPGASEEERRTAGYVAAKLMREHGIAVGGPSVQGPTPPRAPYSTITPPAYGAIDLGTAGAQLGELVRAAIAPGGLLEAILEFRERAKPRRK